MRLTIVILIAFLVQVSAASFGQRITLNQRNTPLSSALKEIRKQSGYDIFYDSRFFSKDQKIDVSLKNATLQEALESVFKGLALTYEIEDKTVVIKKKEPPLLDNIIARFQEIDVRGRILDQQKNPLPGATIKVRGTNQSVVSNEKGEFLLRNVEEKATLIIAYIGYQTVELAAAQDLGNIELVLSTSALQQVDINVVNTGYQTIDKDRAAGSFAKPDLNVMLNRTSAPDILTRLEGLVPGLTSRGPVGLLVRGQSSINAGTAPLIVVDGIEFTGNMNQVNMQDVESINVLKDATASSIWGAKAANGVIVITTKKGKAGDKLKFDYDGYYAFQGRPDLDYVPRLNSQQFIALARELFPQYSPFNNNYVTVSNTYNSLPHLKIQYDRARNLITQAQADFKLDSLANLSNTGQINNLFVRDAATLNQTISASGGGKSHTFYGSFNHISTQDNTPGNQNNQYKINLNNNFILGKRFTVSINADLTDAVTRSGNTYKPDRAIVPYQLFQDANGKPLNVNYLGPGQNSVTPLPDSLRTVYQANSRLDLSYNPILEQDRAYNTSNGLFARLVGSVKANIIKGLDFQSTVGYNVSNTNTRQVLTQDNYQMRYQVLQYTVAANPTVVPVYNIPNLGGKLVVGTNSSTAWTIRNQLLFNRDWNKHQLTLMAGQQATSSTPVSTSATYYGWDDQLQTSRPVDLARLAGGMSGVAGFALLQGNNVGGGEGRIARSTSYFATLGYTFDRKYTLNGSWRIDESNLFGRDKSAQNRPVYSMGAVWALGKEDFMLPLNWLDQLNVRLTYGITGNAPQVGAAASYDILTANNSVNYPTGAAFLLSSPANTKLTWESTKVYNAGIDFSIFKNRLSGSIEGYIKKTEDLIGPLATSPLTGYASVLGNFGNLDNKGIDIGLNSNNIRSSDFSWSTGLTFSYNKNKLTKLNETAPTAAATLANTTRAVGYPLYTSYVYNYGGLNAVGDPQFRRADGSVSAAVGANGPVVADMLYMGTTQPVWSGGLQNSFRYKSFGLSANIIYNGGYVMHSNQNPTLNQTVFAANTVQLGFLDRWKVPGDENRTDIPRYAPSAAIANARNLAYYTNSQRFTLNGAYAKLRDITLSYSLPQPLVRKINAQAISFRFQVNNLLLWTANHQGMDPEFTGLTRDAQGTVSLGAHITF